MDWKISWNDYLNMTQAIMNGTEIQRLAEKEKWIKEMMGQARVVKADLSKLAAEKSSLETEKRSIGEARAKMSNETKELEALKKRVGAAELDHETKVKTFRSEMALAEADLKKREDAIAELEKRAGENFNKSRESLENLRAAGVNV